MKNKYQNQYPLKIKQAYRLEVAKIINALDKIPRTGWKDRDVKNPETVGEHTDELVILSEKLFTIPGLNIMLKIHDWPESEKNIGDRRTDPLCPLEKRWSLEQKHQDEAAAMELICSRLGADGEELLNLWLEYEERKTERAIIAYQLDKYQMIKKAITYQIQGEPVIAQEFIDYDGPKIKNLILKSLLEQVMKSLK